MTDRPAFGIDLGGTKTEGIVLGAGDEIRARYRVATVPGSYADTLRTIRDLVERLERESGSKCTHLGVGIPGSVSPQTGRVRNANSTWINGQLLEQDLQAAMGRPVRLENDANCLALSESRDGAAKGVSSVFAVILGTGVGGGFMVNGQLFRGANRLAAEWGHVPLPHEDKPIGRCFCGKENCIERALSGPGLLRAYKAAGGTALERVEQLQSLANGGDPLSRQVLERHREQLAAALGMLVNILDPAVFVLGGGVSLLPGLAEALPDLLRPHIFAPSNDRPQIDIRLAKWGDSSGVLGAARLWDEQSGREKG